MNTVTKIIFGITFFAVIASFFISLPLYGSNNTLHEPLSVGKYQIIKRVPTVVDFEGGQRVTIITHTLDTATGEVTHTTHMVNTLGDVSVSVTKFPMLEIPYHSFNHEKNIGREEHLPKLNKTEHF
jgi:hypothetical protein